MDEAAAIRAVVKTAGDEVLAELKTAATHPFVAADGTVDSADRWVLATDRRCWIVARADDGRRWTWATGDVTAVTLDPGWTRDVLHVGPWRLPLGRGQRSEAEALVERFVAGGGGGPDVATPLMSPPALELARGALGVPAELATGDAGEERALVGVTTATPRPFAHHHGTLHDSPWTLIVTSHRTLRVARAPWGEADHHEVRRLEGTVPRTGRPALEADGQSLLAPTAARAVVPDLLALHAARTPAARWRAAARLALGEPDPARALALWTEARELGIETGGFLADVAAVAWAFDQGEIVIRAWAAADSLPEDVVAHARAVEDADRALRRALGRQKLRWSAVSEGLGLSGLPPVDRVDGLAWPCERYAEAMATGLATRGAYGRAAALWGLVEDEPRRLGGLAVLREALDGETGRATWRAAALAHAARGAWAAASAALERAAGDDPSAEDHAQLARWALAAAADPEPHWRAALASDPHADFADEYADAEWASLLAAARDDAPEARARALEVLVERDPTIARYEALAALLADPLCRPADAAAALEQAAELADTHQALDEPPEADEVPRHDRWTRIAELRARASATAGAVDALVEAVTGSFLEPEAYRRALDSQVTVDPALRAWWTHLRDVLGTTPPEPHPRWIEGFDDATLEALHPGGIGWLDRLRQTYDPSEPPDRSQLVRGLERMTVEAWPRAHRRLEDACGVLGMPVPETFLYRGEGAWGVSAWPTHPPVLLVGIEHLAPGPRELDDAALTFALAVELSHLRCGHPVLALDKSLIGTSRSMYAAFGTYATTAETVFEMVTMLPGLDQVAKLQRLFRIGRRMITARSVLDKASELTAPLWRRLFGAPGEASTAGIGRENLRGAGLQVRMHADRIALLVTGDLHAAIRAVLTASTRSAGLLAPIARDGLLSVLTTDRMPADEALRITALIAFAAGRRPDLPDAT